MKTSVKTVFHNGHRYKIVRHEGTVTVSVHICGRYPQRAVWRRILHEGTTGLKVLAKERKGC